MKKLVLLGITALATLTLAACSPSSNEEASVENPKTEESAAEKQITANISGFSFTHRNDLVIDDSDDSYTLTPSERDGSVINIYTLDMPSTSLSVPAKLEFLQAGATKKDGIGSVKHSDIEVAGQYIRRLTYNLTTQDIVRNWEVYIIPVENSAIFIQFATRPEGGEIASHDRDEIVESLIKNNGITTTYMDDL